MTDIVAFITIGVALLYTILSVEKVRDDEEEDDAASRKYSVGMTEKLQTNIFQVGQEILELDLNGQETAT